MIKKAVAGVVLFLVVVVGGLSLAGIPPNFIIYGPGVATGIGSKLLCSAEFVIGNSREQAFDDLVQYDPILSQLSISYDDEAKTVTTSLFGLKRKTASYIPGLGCSVDYAGYNQRHAMVLQQTQTSNAAWPAGNTVAAPRPEIQSLLEGLLREDNEAGLNTRALLVVHEGEIVGEAYGQDMTPRSQLLGWSMAKSLNAIMLGNLEMRGIIDLKAKPGFSQWQADERTDISIEHLLNMTDGLRFSEQYAPGDDATAMLFTAASSSDYVLEKPLAAEPGTRFNYSSGTANILARLYTDTLGGPQAAYDNFVEAIYRPMGFQHAVYETDASGVFMGSSYVYASARDWARMGLMMLNGGIINGQRIVTEEWVERATTPNQSDNDKAYGYQWWLNAGNDDYRYPNLPEDMYYANGNRQQSVMVIPSRDIVVVRLGWTAGRYPLGQHVEQILDIL
ncbi:MAG: beta-lactamase family protein [Pseudomonadales bacterium]|nr:beta-lactamase family protein [Pseudomonadales bacterium]